MIISMNNSSLYVYIVLLIDLLDGKEKPVMGMIWMLVKRFGVGDGGTNVNDGMRSIFLNLIDRR